MSGGTTENEERARRLLQNEGEGSRSAARDYEQRQQQFDRTHDAEALAEQARREVEKSPEEFRRAEQAGKEKGAE